MSSLTVHVKWQKQKFSDVPVDTSQPPELFKATLYSLSGVPPDRQKVMVKGAVLPDDSWSGIALKPGATVMLLGSAEALPEAPATPPVKFVEDMDESELAKAIDLPPGLNNLGNTCYMNATLQCLRSVPELRSILSKNRLAGLGGAAASGGGPEVLVSAMSNLFAALEKSGNSVSPHVFLHLMHAAFPQFATKAEGGVFQQQDANECWVELVRCLQSRLPTTEAGGSTDVSFTDRYLTGSMTCRLTCQECGPEAEPEVNLVETFSQLSCFIDKDVKYLHTGLTNAMKSSLTKRCDRLGRDAVYSKQSKITRLPAYLTVQFVRFYYKEKEQVNAKVLKDVKFSLTLDVYQLCSEELQARLKPVREQLRRMDEWLALQSGAAKRRPGGPAVAQGAEQAATADTGTNNASWPPSLPPLDPGAPPPPAYYFEDDPGSNASGQYMLQAVLTHQGRSSSSGHYLAWVRKADQPANANPEEDVWFKFDDDYVSPVTGADILRLSGGGDWHCAYLLLYGPRQLDRDYSSLPPPTDASASQGGAAGTN
uniref:Ubiquitin carboxyl-terminal hydrolase n=2 Tax=Macrostomum lignano TaxID=282301 RepID=A0A1I8J846_9PLAT